MPRVPLRGFIGGFAQSRSVRFDQAQAINLFAEIDESQAASSPAMLVSTPGLRRFCILPRSPLRGLYTTSEGRVFAVAADTLYELFQGNTFLPRGTLRTQTGQVVMTENGLSLVLVDGLYGYTMALATNAFLQITDADMPAATHCAYLDGYIVFNEVGTGRFHWTDLLDGDTIDALNFATAEASPDPLQALLVIHRELWLFGTRTTEVWFSTGDANNPFARLQGALLDMGLAAPYAAVAFNDTVAWLAQEPTGGVFVVMAQGFLPKRISTHALEHQLGTYPQVRDAVAWAHLLEGHRFMLVSFPDGNATWAFDAATSQWHQRAWLNDTGGFDRHRCHVGCAGLGTVLGGDWEHGLVYELDPEVYDDDGRELVRQRVTPWVSTTGQLVTHHALCLDMDVGVGLASGRVPQVLLRWSNDGQTWSPWQPQRSAGVAGDYLRRVEWRRLGQARRRLYEIRVTDDIPVHLIGAYLEVAEDAH